MKIYALIVWQMLVFGACGMSALTQAARSSFSRALFDLNLILFATTFYFNARLLLNLFIIRNTLIQHWP